MLNLGKVSNCEVNLCWSNHRVRQQTASNGLFRKYNQDEICFCEFIGNVHLKGKCLTEEQNQKQLFGSGPQSDTS